MEWTVPARLDKWEDISEDIVDLLNARGFKKSDIISFIVALEEAFVNISNYAYDTEAGDVTIEVDIDDEFVTVHFTDNGIPFNPLTYRPPDISEPSIKRKIGGLGIHLIRSKTDFMSYEYQNGKNILTLTKKFN